MPPESGSAAPPFDVVPFFACLVRARALAEHAPPADPLLGPSRLRRAEEAVELAVAWALRRRDDGTGDLLIAREPSLAAPLAFGAPPLDILRQELGRATAPTRGREAGARWTDFQRGLFAPIPPEGTMLEVAAGIGLALRSRGEKRVVAVLSGEGASSGGGWHEGLNFAAVRRVPLLLLVSRTRPEGEGARAPRHSRLASFVEKCAGYGIEGRSVDGGDPFAVHEAARAAALSAREGGGVQLLEVWSGEGDPLPALRSAIEAGGWAGRDDLDRIEEKARSEVEEAHEQAAGEDAANVSGEVPRRPALRSGTGG